MDLRILIDPDESSDSGLSSPCSWISTPPSSPQRAESIVTTPGNSHHESPKRNLSETQIERLSLSIRTKPHQNANLQTEDDRLAEIKRRRNVFFASVRHVLLQLLGNTTFFDQLDNSSQFVTAKACPYKALAAQPRGIRGILKPYQLEGVSWLLCLRNNGIGGILADDMGLGKTLQTISLFQYLSENEAIRGHRFLVVCPLSVIDTWISEVSKWTTGLTALSYHGNTEERQRIRKRFSSKDSHVDILVTSYETLHTDISWLRRMVWSYVALDEGHRIKNVQSKRARNIHKIRSEYKLVLTGTPVQNNLTELWSILHWLYPDVFVPQTMDLFEDAFSLNEGKFDTKFLDHTKQFLKHIMLRRTKESREISLNIPPKEETILSVPLTDLQLSWYWKILTGVDKSLIVDDSTDPQSQPTISPPGFIDLTTGEWETDGLGVKKRSRITTNILMELRKCSIHPYLLEDAFPANYELGHHIIENSGKFIVLQKMIRQFVIVERKKVIVFSGFDRALSLCEDLLELEKAKMQFKHVRLDGSTPSAWRNLSVFLFQNNPSYMVFLLSIRAGGEGLNLVSASTVIFLDEDWNPQVMKQAESRVHRLGQTTPVNVFRLHAKGTVEEQMRHRLSKKAYLAAKVVDDAQSIGAYTPVKMQFPQNISLVPSSDIVSDDLDFGTLGDSDLDIILRSCAIDQAAIPEISQSEQNAWLARSERVKTDIFNGEKVDTSTRSYSTYQETILDVSKADRRIGKSRTVIIDGYEVAKENIERRPVLVSSKPEVDKRNTMVHQTVSF
ncbi:hypothetical protein ARAM_002001 [Aspergillus rambellii]|uniref:Uncharacterized protein n=1 Tax=Aspergillus rambellii TaxID=308745 RepID=A0A0F8W5Z8_9EURO|nr:hypothetical protein ARAM_002001 [Aspergillus rambellii]